MKKQLFLSLGFVFLVSIMFAQSNSLGMRYQAIARDADGKIISNESMDVKAELFSADQPRDILYGESHELTSNQYGLLNLTIGGGKMIAGDYDLVPWSDQDIWVQISVKRDSDQEFKIITTSELLSVPYAHFSITAGEVLGGISLANALDGMSNLHTSTAGGGGAMGPLDIDGNVPAAFQWNLFGNEWYSLYPSLPFPPALGTTDNTPLIFITNGEERMRIEASGELVLGAPGSETTFSGPTTVTDKFTVSGIQLMLHQPFQIHSTMKADS